MENRVYKILSGGEWEAAFRAGEYSGSADDLRDGYIHFSTAGQVPGTLARHFAGQTGLVVLECDSDAMGDSLRWELSRGGQLFPHFYGTLAAGLVRRVLPCPAAGEAWPPAGTE